MRHSSSTRSPRRGRERGSSLLEILVALGVFAVIVFSLLPLLDQAVVSDYSSQNTTEASYAATRIMETLKVFRSIQLSGGAIPEEFNSFEVGEYSIDDEGVWTELHFDPELFEMDYELEIEPVTAILLARVSVTSKSPYNEQTVEFTSAVE